MPIFIQNGAKFEILELWFALMDCAKFLTRNTEYAEFYVYIRSIAVIHIDSSGSVDVTSDRLALLFTIDFANKIASGVYLHRQKITKTNIYLKKFYCRQRSKLQIVPKIIRSFSYPNRHSVCLPNSTLCMEDDDDYGQVRFLCPRRAPAVTFASNSILVERCCIELVQSMSAGWAWAPDKKLPEYDKGPPPPTTSRIDGRHPTGLGFCWKEIFTFFYLWWGIFDGNFPLRPSRHLTWGTYSHSSFQFQFVYFIKLSNSCLVVGKNNSTQMVHSKRFPEKGKG